VEAVIQQVVDATRDRGIALAIVAPDAEQTNRRLRQGFQMVVTNVPALLMRSSRDMLAAIDR